MLQRYISPGWLAYPLSAHGESVYRRGVSDSVALYRCKRCKVRMFERDCAGHLARHGVRLDDPKFIPVHFEKGADDTAPHPGDPAGKYSYGTVGGRKKGKPAIAVEEADPDEVLEDLN